MLDLSSLRKALAALERSMAFLASDLAKDPDLYEQFRTAAVQTFEFTHEVAFKMLKRQLEGMTADPGAVDKMPYLEVIRSGAEAGLVANVANFRDYREKRDITSHTYDPDKAAQIVAVLPTFHADIQRLLQELERRNREDDGSGTQGT